MILGVSMTRPSLIATVGAALLAVGAVAAAHPQTEEKAPLEQFNAAIRGYVQLHRAIERQLPPLRGRSNADDVVGASNAMASALQKARANAREGDIFRDAIAVQLRARIADALDAAGLLPEELL